MKYYFFVFLFSQYFGHASAQTQVWLGLKGGLGVSVVNKGNFGKKRINSPVAGALIQVAFTKNISVETGAHYIEKGGGFSYRYLSNTVRDYFTFKVIEVPLLFKVNLGEKRVKAFAGIGPFVGYNSEIIRITKESLTGLDETIRYSNFDMYDDEGLKPRRADLGLVLNAGLSVDAGRGRIFLDARHSWGYRDWFQVRGKDPSNPNYNFNSNLKYLNHRSLSICLGYMLPLSFE